MDQFTFGKSKAAIELARMLSLDENNKFSEKVKRFLDNFNRGIAEFLSIEDDAVRRRAIGLWRQDCFSSLDKAILPDEIRSFTKCVADTKYKKALKN